MNILCVAPIDNGGQMINLTDALNKHTDHSARCVTTHETYLGYDTDIRVADHTTADLRDVLSDTDFFIFSEVFPADAINLLAPIGLYKRCTPQNTIIRTAGSYRTMNTQKLFSAWVKHDLMFAGPYDDWFISGRVGRMAPVNYICPTNKIPSPRRRNRPIRICCSPTSAQKGADKFVRATNKLIDEGYDVGQVLIQKQPWKNAINQKASCHITFDQFMLKHVANSAIESMYLGHAVVSDVRSWCRMIHPDLPVVSARTEDELYTVLVDLVENKELAWIGKMGKDYVNTHHSPAVVAKQWNYLIDHVANEKNNKEVYPNG